MPATTITSSPNIASLNSNLIADLCAGFFYVDLTPSIYIGSGANNVLGAKVQITNPFNVVVRAFPSTYDMAPALSGSMDAVISFAVPTQANNFQYGKYLIEVQLTDADGTNYKVSKTISICAPNPLDKTKKFGTISAKLSGVCSAGKVYVLVDNEPTYKGFISGSAVRSFTLDYPTGSGVVPLVGTPQPSFNAPLFEGVYKIVGTSCASYDYGDHITVKIQYKVNYNKNILCSLDECCVFSGLEALNRKLNSDCSDQEKEDTEAKISQAAFLLDTIDYGSRCGDDISDYILQLEDVLGQTCSCTFNEATPIINNNPSSDILIQGCNVTSVLSGLTKVYTIDNYTYSASVVENGGALNISTVFLNGCVQSQALTFNVAVVYSQIKNTANSTLVESQFWAGVIKKSLNAMDASCLGLTTDQLTALTFDQLVQDIINKACAGGNCTATIDSTTATQQGGNVLLSWTETGAYSIDIFVDGIFINTVLSSITSYLLLGYSNGITHTYRIISKCSNGNYGTAKEASFGFSGCATIVQPTVSSSSVSNATCPFDLTGLVSPLPMGITAVWHTANNTLVSTLVPDEKNVSDGIYYVFATDGAGCYSTGVKVTVTCAVSSSCTAPQNLTVTSIIGGLKVAFQSAAYPPPANSYTIQRKAAADPDIPGSYSTLGSPTYNVSTGKWEKLDSAAVNNTLYTYKAISNCGMTTPSVMTNYANISCPTVTLSSPDTTTINYSFNDIGGQIDKYTVEIRDNTGVTLIHTNTHLPSLVFPTPIAGSFTYLTAGTNYKIRVIPFIGVNSFPCPYYNQFTGAPLSVVASRSGNFSGTLSALVDGGVAPYSYLWTVVASGGLCEAHTITSPTAASTAFTCTAYANVVYQFTVRVTDYLGTIVSANAPLTLACLVPDTLITMKDGSTVELGSLNKGDELFGGNNKVESFERRTVDKLYIINGGLLKASEGHIHIIGSKLIQSANLKEGDMLKDKFGLPVVIDSIEIEEGEFEVINISTTSKTYIANGILTHNKIACP